MPSTLVRPESKSLGTPDRVKTFPKAKIEFIEVGGKTLARATLQPGWRWSTSIKPIVNTDSCESSHFQYLISGSMIVELDDGTRIECKAGDVSLIPPGHDAWVVGKEPAVALDFEGLADFAKL